jgi:hypothetical protein
MGCRTTWNLLNVMRALASSSVPPLMNAGDMSMLTGSICCDGQPCSARSWARVRTALTSRPSVTLTTRRAAASAARVMES